MRGDPDTTDMLFDAYLEAATRDDLPDVEVFLQGREPGRPELRARLESIAAIVRASRPRERGEASRAADVPRERLGDFRLVRRLAQGGMGVLYLAEQEPLGRQVALKVVRPEFAGSPAAAERLRREARALARVRHPGIAAVYGAGEEDGILWIAMELVPGESLSERLTAMEAEGRALDLREVLRVGLDVARALAAAHAAGVVHRDVKPSNVRITPEGRAVLVDFGLARELDAEGPTLTYTFAGSPAYASPEQVAGRSDLDGRTDVYSLGVTLYRCVTGVAPFRGETLEAVLHQVLSREPAAPRRIAPELPRDLEIVLRTAMCKERERRYPSAAALASDLQALSEGRDITARPAGPLRLALGWARREPLRAAAVLLAVLGGAALIGGMSIQRRLERASARIEAASAVERARTRVDELRRDRASAATSREEISRLRAELPYRFLTDAELARLAESADEVDRLRRARHAAYYEVIELLRRAERLDANVAGADDVLVELHTAELEEARFAGDRQAAAIHEGRLMELDPEGTVAARRAWRRSVTLHSRPPGAEVSLFQLRLLSDVLPGSDHRSVLVPSGARALERGPAPGFERSLDPSDAALSDENARLGTAPTRPVELAAGTYVAIARLEGRDPARIRFTVFAAADPGARQGPLRYEIRLPPAGTTPGGFVLWQSNTEERLRHAWLQKREVVAAEYLEFLNDPATAALAPEGSAARFAPRSEQYVAGGSWWPRGRDGHYSLPEGWSADWPVVGVSWHDAVAFAEWRTRRARAAGLAHTYRLPTRGEFTAAASGGEGRWVFGDRFNPRWTSSCFTRETPGITAAMSHPFDVSPFGLYDVAGSVQEWLDEWWSEERGQRHAAGGAWAIGSPETFTCPGGEGYAPESTSGMVGFRLALDIGGVAW